MTNSVLFFVSCLALLGFGAALVALSSLRDETRLLRKAIFGPYEIKFKKVDPRARIIQDLHSQDEHGNLGADVCAVDVGLKVINGVRHLIYNTGLAFETPFPIGLLAFPRSSLGKTNLMLSNSVGVIDRNYRGEVLAIFKVDEAVSDLEMHQMMYDPGDRIIQMVVTIMPKVEYKEHLELSDTSRSDSGFGSTGR